jgi:glycosyltransferase involved in cell wall biosynthesis
MSEPIVTLVICPREAHFMTVQSLLNILADDAIPFKVIYVDVASPPDIAEAIRRISAARGFKVIRHNAWIAPATARKEAIAEVKTKYVACIDNDVLVEPGCLKTLIDCAEETGAGLVCPLYIQAGGGRPSTIHMAGGVFTWSDDETPELIGERHLLASAPVSVADTLVRSKADFTEYHYVVGRMDLMGRPEVISDDILLIHEHLDLALVARQQGLEVMVEPSARATYVAFEPRALQDLDFYRRRWDKEACAQSVYAFARKWVGADRSELVDSTLDYIDSRLQEVELRLPGSRGNDLAEPMAREELAQNRCALREQSLARGYSANELRMIDEAADFATMLFDGLYRADGRPFITHAIGTASALIRYELNMDVIQAGLLHAAFMLRPQWMPEAELSATFARQPAIATLVRNQPNARNYLNQDEADVMTLNITGGAVACILAANETDLRLSGEYRAAGRPADLTGDALERIGVILGMFGVEGLARSAQLPAGEGQTWPLFGVAGLHTSFRFDPKTRRPVPV